MLIKFLFFLNILFISSSSSTLIEWNTDNRYCLNVKNGKKGNTLQIWSCYEKDVNFQFDIKNNKIKWQNECLEILNGYNYNGNLLQISNCNNNNNQLFEFKNGNIKWKNKNKCFDVMGGYRKDGIPVFIWDCNYKNPNQKFNIKNQLITNNINVPSNNDVCIINENVKVLSYNLFWWNLYGKRNGNGGSASNIIRKSHFSKEFDIIGFQECENIDRVLSDAGLFDVFSSFNCGHAVSIAYNKKKWNLVSKGKEVVAEDKKSQYYGHRIVGYVRIKNKNSNFFITFLNHHGPLPVNSGGREGSHKTAENILKVIKKISKLNDLVILIGDFNADRNSKTIGILKEHLNDLFSSNSFGGVDHIFSNSNKLLVKENLGSGGSDHDAITITLKKD